MTSNKTVTVFRTASGRRDNKGKYHIKDGRTYLGQDDTHCGIVVPKARALGVEMSLDDPRICKTCLKAYLKKTGYRV